MSRQATAVTASTTADSQVKPAISESSSRAPADLRVRDLRVSYGSQIALHGVSIDVPAGACVAVLGTNGAGKSTLMNAVAGLERPSAGSITLAGESVTGRSAHHIAALGVCYVPEGRGVFPDLSVSDNLRVSLGRSRDAHDAFYEYFPQLRLCSQRAAGTLSGGEQQMLAMAPALLTDYRLLLVDELSLGLAPLVVESLFEVLDRIRASGVSILLVEQFADRALALADSAYVLRKGQIVYNGPAAELEDQPERLHVLYLGEDAA